MVVPGSTALFFGKLPSYADFLRFNAAGREALAFDDWLQRGLGAARAQLGAGWEQAFSRSPAYNFVFYPDNAERFLSGILQPSQDKSQRKYPFVISLLTDRRCFRDNEAHLTPLAFSGFFERAAQVMSRATAGPDIREMTDEAQGLAGTMLDPSGADARYRNEYLNSVPMSSFWQALFGTFEDPRKYLLMKNLTEALLPVRGRSTAHLALGLSFPLPADNNAAPFFICFWINISLVLLRSTAGRPFLFWSIPGNDTPGRLYLFFRQPSARHFVKLVQPDIDDDTICAVDQDGKTTPVMSAQSGMGSYRTLLDTGDQKMGRFLGGLATAAG